MTIDQRFTFVTSQDEYHCFLEKILTRATNLYVGLVPDINSTLVDDYVLMEKYCLKEDYLTASLHYIKQLEEILTHGFSSLNFKKVLLDLRQEVNEQWILSSFGDKLLNYPDNKNKEIIEKIKKNQTIESKEFKFIDKLKLFKNYFESNNPSGTVDSLLYYKRNCCSHGAAFIKADKELKFNQEFRSCFYFMTHTQINLSKYAKAISLPKNR